jgi:hypothetical protein
VVEAEAGWGFGCAGSPDQSSDRLFDGCNVTPANGTTFAYELSSHMPLIRDAVIIYLHEGSSYMKAQARPLCATCLSRALRLPFDRTMDAWADIRLRRDLPIRAGHCSACGGHADEVLHPAV